MYAKPFASPKNLVGVETIKNKVKQSKLPQIDHSLMKKANIGASLFKVS